MEQNKSPPKDASAAAQGWRVHTSAADARPRWAAREAPYLKIEAGQAGRPPLPYITKFPLGQLDLPALIAMLATRRAVIMPKPRVAALITPLGAASMLMCF